MLNKALVVLSVMLVGAFVLGIAWPGSFAPAPKPTEPAFHPQTVEFDGQRGGVALNAKQLLDHALERLAPERTIWLKTKIRQTLTDSKTSFTAEGTLSIPIFQEAKFRGDKDVAVAQVNELNSEFNDLTNKIDQQLRDSLLDLQSAQELVRVARSNVELATKTLVKNGAGDLFGIITTPDGIVAVNDGTNALELFPS